MIPQVIVHPKTEARVQYLQQQVKKAGMHHQHPDLLWMAEEKLGVEQAKAIRSHLSLKPFQALNKMLVVIHADHLTPDAQNALLKTLEEPEGEAELFLGVSREDQLLPTILSRCQIVHLEGESKQPEMEIMNLISQLQKATVEERFQAIEKIDDKQAFLQALVYYFQQHLPRHLEFMKNVLEAEEWSEHNVTLRAILEYLMLDMPI